MKALKKRWMEDAVATIRDRLYREANLPFFSYYVTFIEKIACPVECYVIIIVFSLSYMTAHRQISIIDIVDIVWHKSQTTANRFCVNQFTVAFTIFRAKQQKLFLVCLRNNCFEICFNLFLLHIRSHSRYNISVEYWQKSWLGWVFQRSRK